MEMRNKQFKELLQNSGFNISKTLFDIENPIHDIEHSQYGVQIELVSITGEYESTDGILKTTVDTLSPNSCLDTLKEKVLKGVPFDCFFRGNKGKFYFSYESRELSIYLIS